jgi:Cysteine rich repeat
LCASGALTSPARQTLIALLIEARRDQMSKILFIVPFLVMASAASAQQGHDACARDVSRYCRAVMNDGDSSVLGCLKQHRGRLSKACDKVLTDNGQ